MPFQVKIPLCLKCKLPLDEKPPYEEVVELGLPKNWRKGHRVLECPKVKHGVRHNQPQFYVILKNGSTYAWLSGTWQLVDLPFKTVKRKGRLIGSTMQNTNQE